MKSVIHNVFLEQVVQEIANIKTDTLVFLVDHNVWAHYSKAFDIYKNFKGKNVILWKAIDGEKVKNYKEYESCMEFLLEKGVQRTAHIVAIGGGALSDFAGFVAATILRGVSWSVIPTSLLSMVDASIGGKVAINSAHGKNLVGAFHYPENVWINTDFLETLPEEEKNNGKGEILKYCFLNKEIYETTCSKAHITDIILKCAKYKEEITSSDFKEKGMRKFLNFGHTLGHAIEKHYVIPHGQAVLLGIALILFIEQREDLIKELKKLTDILNVKIPEVPWLNRTFPLEQIMEYVRKDKKSISTTDIELITIKEIGEPQIVKRTFDEVHELLGSRLEELKKFDL